MSRPQGWETGIPAVERRGRFRRAVIDWYRKNARPLPWRGTTDPYRVWVSEIALQQTRVDQGTPYIERFLDDFPDVRTLAAASSDAVLKRWEGLGYYARARNIHRAARIIVDEYGGALPKSACELQKLPGIGPYTAGAISSIAFDTPVPILDGNVKRLLTRLTDLKECIDDAKTVEALWALSAYLVQGRSAGDFNQGLMEIGAAVCTPRSPSCADCPVAQFCLARKRGTQSLRPVRQKKQAVPHYQVAIAAIRKNGRYLLGRRPENGLLGGLWEFPGGKIKHGEKVRTAIEREIREELDIRVAVGEQIATVHHAYSHFRVTLHVFLCRHVSGQPTPRAHTDLKWVQPSRFREFAIPKANHKFLDKL